MTANIITLARILFVFVAVFLYGTDVRGQIAAFLLTLLVIWMDALDGWVARRRGTSSDLGALLDITGDRIVEMVFWVYFAVTGMISLWIPLVVIARGFLTDSMRSLAFAEGQTAFGEKTMMRSPLTRLLVASRFSRGLYGAAKAVIFCWLGGLIALRGAITRYAFAVPRDLLAGLELAGRILAWVVLVMCLLRGLPVLWDGRRYLLEKRFPRDLRDGD
ncbi:MAG: CDP-alcohol phosphatidyltransferase family protein [Candidatus Krumholzibacteriota bacterium]|nr:CDP-alcohol phosphatidyltransferase family protein [Candidatus Krumholzibacteriota bacterium]